LKQLGYEIIERDCDPKLYENVRKDHPFVVFNLSSVYGRGNTNLVPAVLEIAGVPYTGSGMLALSLAHNYTKLFPFLLNSGIPIFPFRILKTGDLLNVKGLKFPLLLYRNWEKHEFLLRNESELRRIIKKFSEHEKILLMKPQMGKMVSLFILDNIPFLRSPGSPYLTRAQKAYRLLDARGLVRFDFIQSSQPLLARVEIAPDPLDEELLQQAALSGWHADQLLQILVEHAGNDSMTLIESNHTLQEK
jgi:hypothetical protein